MANLPKLANMFVSTRRQLDVANEKLAMFEKRAEAEEFLREMSEDNSVPANLRPTTISDFLEKRAALEKTDLGTAKLAARMAGSPEGFEIGSVEAGPDIPSTGSNADNFFVDYLLSSQ